MEEGDYFQCPKEVPFKVPAHYNDPDNKEVLNELFWVQIMQPDQPFDFAKRKNL